MTETDPRHRPVLLDEVAAVLAPAPGETVADATAGLGGHAARLAEAASPDGAVILNDLDPGNLAAAAERVESAAGGACRVETVRGPFADLPAWLEARGVRAGVVLADLGFASVQVDDPARGLSFRHDGPLDMRLDPDGPTTAADLVNTLGEADLADMIYRFGEERMSRRIARAIVKARAGGPIETTGRLAQVVRGVMPPARPGPRGPKIDPATRTFQALRIAVNDELGQLAALLAAVERSAAERDGWLAPGARVAVISFHSLEDRAVKEAFGRLVAAGLASAVRPEGEGARGRDRKPVTAGEAERSANPRARSAKLRAIRLLGR